MNRMVFNKYLVIIFGLATVYCSIPVQAQQPAMLTVSSSAKGGTTGSAINIKVWSGRATAIDFTGVNELITQIFLADPSRFTYATDTPLEKGQAMTVFLRRIQPLKFPNLTTTTVTNLFIETVTSDGVSHLYTFNLQPGENSPQYSGISIIPISELEISKRSLEVGSFRKATIDDIERGLVFAMRQSYTPSSDTVVAKVREFLALSRNTDKSLVEIAQDVRLSLSVLNELGLLGIRDKLKTPLTTQIKLR
ncbi:hypothetical protein HCG51_11475 [Tolypothrix sp. PCC 7910]|nr:hypothetical protein HCG51_11475 [Tolypothrix sp. PCC 7910]